MAEYRGVLPPGPFGTLLVDPPWRLRGGGFKRKLHYDTMTLDELKNMGDDIRRVTTDDAHLWLWTPTSHLPEALELADAWSFEYKTLRTWRKVRASGKQFLGLGWWLRGTTEHLIFAVRSSKKRVQPGRWSTYLEAPWRGHSIKPEEAIACIEALSPPPRLELFARSTTTRCGWTIITSDRPPDDPYGQSPGEDRKKSRK